jgi:zinc protease
VQRHFSRFAPRAICPVPEAVIEPPMTEIRRQELGLPHIGAARLMMAWVGPGADQLRSAYGLDLLSVLLSGGRTSRFVRELREERQLVQDISSGFSLQRDSSLFTVTAWLDPAHLDQVEAIVGDRLAELAAVPVSEPELRRYQRLLCNDYAFSTETTSQIAGLYGYYSTIAQPELSAVYPRMIQAIEPDELSRLAEQYLSPCRYAATVLRPC